MNAAEYNAAPKQKGYKGIVAIDYEIKLQECITTCPYNHQTPMQALLDFSLVMNGQEPKGESALVGSLGCVSCIYYIGDVGPQTILCGMEAHKSMKKTFFSGDKYKTPRTINIRKLLKK